ncbi:unnamed protein product [Pieris brassicae]|uniref:Uncharacterized protein n=1 Tax=Pieris brassicae TaxID=7116 RepID=A0A9P0TS95_PIEBR|nr:unnamed protein product [Pieris brassicae]
MTVPSPRGAARGVVRTNGLEPRRPWATEISSVDIRQHFARSDLHDNYILWQDYLWSSASGTLVIVPEVSLNVFVTVGTSRADEASPRARFSDLPEGRPRLEGRNATADGQSSADRVDADSLKTIRSKHNVLGA